MSDQTSDNDHLLELTDGLREAMTAAGYDPDALQRPGDDHTPPPIRKIGYYAGVTPEALAEPRADLEGFDQFMRGERRHRKPTAWDRVRVAFRNYLDQLGRPQLADADQDD